MSDDTFTPPHGMGAKRDTPDRRDRILYRAVPNVDALPDEVNLEDQLPEVYDQGAIGCHDEVTDVLTEAGWVRWADYDGRSPLGTVNPVTHVLEFQAPSAVHVAEYDGPMVYGQHGRMDFCVTPNHRMYLRKWDQRARQLSPDYRFITADRVGWFEGMLAAPSGFMGTQVDHVSIGERTLSGDDFAALLGLIVSDGYASSPESGNPHRVSFCCFREDRYPMVAALAARVGFPEQASRKGVWYVKDEALAAWCRANLYSSPALGARNKRVPALVKAMAPAQIVRFLSFFGDSHHNGSNRHFYTSSRGLADDLQELLLRTGRRCSIHEDPAKDTLMKDGREIRADACAMAYTLVEWKSDNLSITRKKDIGEDRYKGVVYCATVPNSTIVTRRNDQVLISGNSCTGWSGAQVLRSIMMKDGHRAPFMPSPVFLYREARALEGTVGEDAGAEIRDIWKTAAKLGLPSIKNASVAPRYKPEDMPDPQSWAFRPESRWARQPPASVYKAAELRQALTYFALPTTADLMKCLADGYLANIGITIFRSFYGDRGPLYNVPDPNPRRDRVLGGHAVVVFGYSKSRRRWLLRNQWAYAHVGAPTPDGLSPNFTLSFAYLENPQWADSFWTGRLIEGGKVPRA